MRVSACGVASATVQPAGPVETWSQRRQATRANPQTPSHERRQNHRDDANLVVRKMDKMKMVKKPKKVKDEFNVIRQLDHPHICKAFDLSFQEIKITLFYLDQQ